MTGRVLRRLIPIILIRDGYAQVTQKFTDFTYIGDPVNVAKIFSDKMVDEIMVVDVDASRGATPVNLALLARITEHAFVPTAYSGGLETVDQAVSVLRLGYEKVCLNSAFIDTPQLIKQIGESVGQSSVMVEITVSQVDGELVAVDYRSGRILRESISDIIGAAINLGAGEILIKSTSSDGFLEVENIPQLLALTAGCPVPLVYAGGVGSEATVIELWRGGFDGVAAGTWFSLRGRLRAPMIHYPSPVKLDGYRIDPWKTD